MSAPNPTRTKRAYLQELALALPILDGDGPGQVAVIVGGGHIQRLGGVVGEDVRKDGVLHEVVEAAAGVLVELHEVLEVGELGVAPQAGRRLRRLALEQVLEAAGQELVGGVALVGGVEGEQDGGAVRQEQLQARVLYSVSNRCIW